MKKRACLLFIAVSITFIVLAIVFIAGSPELVFNRGPNAPDSPQIYRMKADGTQEVNITQNAFRNYYPDPSPAGDRIVYVTGADAGGAAVNLYLMPSGGGERTQLTTGSYQIFYPRWGSREYANRIVYSQTGSGGADRLYIVDTNGASRLLTNPGPDFSDTMPDIFYSPAGNCYKVIFSRMSVSTQRKRLFLINADGTGDARMVTKDVRDDEEKPVVSHNGRFVAYRAYRFTADTAFEAVRVMTVDDWQPVSEIKLRIPDQVLVHGLGWSRSDRRLYVAMETSDVTDVEHTEDRAEIFSMTIHGADQKRLTKNRVPDTWPSGIPCNSLLWQFPCTIVDAITGE